MEEIVYVDGSLVRLGDRVEVRRTFRKSLTGVVTYCYDETQPVSREVNDYGFSVALSNGKERWYGGAPEAELVLVARKGGSIAK